jgi:15-cis-phytoene synthase
MTPDEYCQQTAAAGGSTFYYSFLFLPPEQRRAITALYAFCGEVDDAVDEAADPAVARAKLTWWRGEVHAAFDGTAQHPVARALAPVVRAYRVAESQLVQIIDGMEMDLDYNRYPDFATLDTYCHRGAGVVGLLAAGIFGYTQPATLDYARTLGIALQLTNIIRDVGEDVRRNRIYLPLDEIARFDLSSTDIIEHREDERFERLMAFQIARARAYYDRALALLPQADRRAQRAGLIMAAMYRALLEEIASLRGRTLNQSVALTPMRKLWIAWRTWIAA